MNRTDTTGDMRALLRLCVCVCGNIRNIKGPKTGFSTDFPLITYHRSRGGFAESIRIYIHTRTVYILMRVGVPAARVIETHRLMCVQRNATRNTQSQCRRFTGNTLNRDALWWILILGAKN